MALYIPWDAAQMPAGYKRKRVFLPRRKFPLEDTCFDTTATPYFSLPNPSGTVRSFLTALERDCPEEAMGYLSAAVVQAVDIDGVKKLFGGKKELHFFSDDILNEIRTVSLACGSGEGKTEVISVRMVAEPNQFGKWKIYCIEKE